MEEGRDRGGSQGRDETVGETCVEETRAPRAPGRRPENTPLEPGGGGGGALTGGPEG